MKEELRKFINDSYSFINEPLEYQKIILEYKSLLGLAEGEHHIEYLRKFLKDDELFIQKIIPFSYSSPYLLNFSQERSCSEKDQIYAYYNSVDPFFNFMCFLLVIYFQNVKNILDEKWQKELILLFFEQFYMEKEQLMFRFERIMGVITSYHLKLIDNSFLKNGNLKNIEDLVKIIDIVDTIHSEYTVINNEDLKYLKNQKSFYENKLKKYERLFFVENEKQKIKEEEFKKQLSQELKPLQDLWLPNAKISLQEVIKIGIDKGIWDENRNIITSKGSIYGKGKSLLASLSVALKTHCFSSAIHSDVLGSAFCQVFNIKINSKVDRPYKSFGSPNPVLTKKLKFAFLKL